MRLIVVDQSGIAYELVRGPPRSTHAPLRQVLQRWQAASQICNNDSRATIEEALVTVGRLPSQTQAANLSLEELGVHLEGAFSEGDLSLRPHRGNSRPVLDQQPRFHEIEEDEPEPLVAEPEPEPERFGIYDLEMPACLAPGRRTRRSGIASKIPRGGSPTSSPSSPIATERSTSCPTCRGRRRRGRAWCAGTVASPTSHR